MQFYYLDSAPETKNGTANGSENAPGKSSQATINKRIFDKNLKTFSCGRLKQFKKERS